MNGIEAEMVRERAARMLADAEEARLARMVAGRRASLRARVARRLFSAAVAVERDAALCAVWERMEAPRRS